MHYEILTPDQPDRIGQALTGLAADPDLDGQMWADAETRLAELHRPGLLLWIVCADGIPAAWAGARVADGWVTCCCNYSRRGWRARDLGVDLWPRVYRARDAWLRQQGLPARTWVFDRPRREHEADGWRVVGSGQSPPADGGHDWWHLVRDPA